ncbi:MAG: SPFH domain-containing protein [Tidjanibacter sp.]|nr:SPFH domain-containing protein [Tidjanibacter sp.]
MENKEYKFSGFRMSGFAALFLIFAIIGLSIWDFATLVGDEVPVLGIVGIVVASIASAGFRTLEPNQARAMVFFGKYKGTFTEEGFWWTNPFYTAKSVSFRARNLNADAIKVNDKTGNPIMIGLVVVWRVKDTYKALFEIDSQTMTQTVKVGKGGEVEGVGAAAGRMLAFENFVRVQSDAALRQVAGMYAYDNNNGEEGELTLRSGADEINEFLRKTLNERLAIAGIEAVEARINYLAYAPEIAAVMLRRQQADAIISAREKIVEGAVSMVHMALDKLKAEGVVELDEERKAAMVSNLLVVLCADESAQPVVNTGSLYN